MARSEEVQEVFFQLEKLTDKDQESVLQHLVQRKYEQRLEERVGLEKKRFIGRPSRMQPEVIERLLIALRQGASISMACKFAGISDDLFKIWGKKARDYQDTLRKITQRELEAEALGESDFKLTPYEDSIINRASKETIDCVELFALIDQAIAECGVRDLNAITKAANNGAWTAAAFRLSKRFPEEYGNTPEQTNINVNVGFQYVEVNKALPKEVEPKHLRAAEEQSIRAAELGIIEVDAESA